MNPDESKGNAKKREESVEIGQFSATIPPDQLQELVLGWVLEKYGVDGQTLVESSKKGESLAVAVGVVKK